MEGRSLSEETIKDFYSFLICEEKSVNTIEKYIRDVKMFKSYSDDKEICKELVISFKQKLIEKNYAVRSINSMLSSVNSFFDFIGWYDCKVKTMKLQHEIYCPEDKELTKAEYMI